MRLHSPHLRLPLARQCPFAAESGPHEENKAATRADESCVNDGSAFPLLACV